MIHLICTACPLEVFMSVDLFLAQTPDRCDCGGMYKLAVVNVEVSE